MKYTFVLGTNMCEIAKKGRHTIKQAKTSRVKVGFILVTFLIPEYQISTNFC